MIRSAWLRGPWSWPARVALLALLLMPLLRGLQAPSGEGLTVTICTEHGAEEVALDADGAKLPPAGKACWFCIAHPGWMVAGVPDPPPPRRVVLTQLAAPMPAGIVARRDFLLGRRTRAPPGVPAQGMNPQG
ncbi:conserved protein of unknown function [Rhodovastum atsumiense]|uniref:DUF2946 domain-containing protein n=1 Tax=Rhodovastum atsumiense TaxID=504468 RepID=A0A5M6ISH1_9PROT|nr:DUF2946 family protein [Rhodovastum atsumiense]KAA5611182.1 DUF2946 domain-containing protein [Rhodovastum atsumiense]CAH2602511.1 conserved protein of unknown function [Rhodovastum atsumiense]